VRLGSPPSLLVLPGLTLWMVHSLTGVTINFL
jgi:hypothetical protein